MLMDSQIEELHKRQRLEKIQTYRLIRDNVLEHQKEWELNGDEIMRCQLETYENLEVSQDRKNCVTSKSEAVDSTNEDQPFSFPSGETPFYNFFLSASVLSPGTLVATL